MTGKTFTKFIESLDKKMTIKKRYILIFGDNCSSHLQNLAFSNVKILFLPSNTTSKTQPMDAGVIKCLKGHYRVKLAKKVALVESNHKVDSTTINLFEALDM